MAILVKTMGPQIRILYEYIYICIDVCIYTYTDLLVTIPAPTVALQYVLTLRGLAQESGSEQRVWACGRRQRLRLRAGHETSDRPDEGGGCSCVQQSIT